MNQLPRNLCTCSSRSALRPCSDDCNSIRPSTMVCSGGNACASNALVSRNMVKFLKEFLELKIGTGFLGHRNQPVQHQDAGLAGTNLAPDNLEQATQPGVF